MYGDARKGKMSWWKICAAIAALFSLHLHQGLIMQTPDAPAKYSTHPAMVIAAVAVVLFCGVGSAAIMGWLPSSSAGGHADSGTSLASQPGAIAPAAAPYAQADNSAPAQALASSAMPAQPGQQGQTMQQQSD